MAECRLADYEKIWPSHLGHSDNTWSSPLAEYSNTWPSTLGRVHLAEHENTLAEYHGRVPLAEYHWPSALGRIREYFGRVPLAEYSNTWPLRSDNLITNRPHLVRGASRLSHPFLQFDRIFSSFNSDEIWCLHIYIYIYI